MNLEKAIEQERYEDAVKYLKLAWELNCGDEAEEKCLKKLRLLKRLGYAKNIHWDREIFLSMAIGTAISCGLLFLICMFIWGIKIASVVGILTVSLMISCVVFLYSDGIVRIVAFLVFYGIVCLFWIIVAKYICNRFWDESVAENVVKVLKVIFVISIPAAFLGAKEE